MSVKCTGIAVSWLFALLKKKIVIFLYAEIMTKKKIFFTLQATIMKLK